jgi:anti-sigma B factor antagonist
MTELASLSLERNGDIVVAAVSGEIDFSVADDLGRRILEWISNEDATLILDLTTVSYTDSAGINLVFDLAARLREHGQAFRIVLPADSQPWRTFSIVGVETEIPIFETLEEADARHEVAPEP